METEFASKTQLSSPSSGVTVDWSNIANAPSYGDVLWTTPVLYKVTSINTTKPTTPTLNDICVDTTLKHFFQWSGSAWTDLGACAATNRVINLADANKAIYATVDGTVWVTTGTPRDNTSVMVNNDGDGRPAQYISDLPTSGWMKIGDVDFAGHFDGGPNKHNAGEINVVNARTNLGIPANTDLDTALADIDTKMGVALIKNTLDMSYDQGGVGVGRLINATDGAVKIDRGAATSASFEIVPKATLPTTGLSDGQLDIKNGFLCIYDASRGKWLSVNRNTFIFGRKGNSSDQYLSYYAGNLVSNSSGLRLIRNATITGLTIQSDTISTFDISILKNKITTPVVYTGSVLAGYGISIDNLNIDMNKDDFIQSLITALGTAVNPVVILEYSWRI